MTRRYELFFWPTPNGYKPLVLLEELGADYELTPIDIYRGAQASPSFQRLSPNSKIPALLDRAPREGGSPLSLFESGELLLYLAEESGRFLATDARRRHATLAWLFWQMAALGPMMGQAAHFCLYAPQSVPYAQDRYLREVRRLLGVLARQLGSQDYLVGEYSIADVACYPWVRIAPRLGLSLEAFGELGGWAARIASRPAVQRAYDRGEPLLAGRSVDAEARRHLFAATDEDGVRSMPPAAMPTSEAP